MSNTKITAGIVIMCMVLMFAMAGDFDAHRIGDAVAQTGKMLYFGLTR